MTAEKLFEALTKYAATQGIALSNDTELVMDLLEGLLVNESRYGYRSCPCRLAKNDKEADKDIVCPCDYRDPDIKEFGHCYCGLYTSNDFNSEGKEFERIAERRPKELR